MVRNRNLAAAPGTAMRLGVVRMILVANNLESQNTKIIVNIYVENYLYYVRSMIELEIHLPAARVVKNYSIFDLPVKLYGSEAAAG